MPSEESKPVEPIVDKGKQVDQGESESEDDEPATTTTDAPEGTSTSGKKKKSKRKKVKQLLTGKSDQEKHDDDIKKAIGGLTPQQMKELVALNPGLMQELASASGSADPSPDQVAALLKRMNLSDIMTGLAASGKNAKDMGAYKFWQTQPVPKFGEDGGKVEEGPLRVQKVEEVDTDAQPLVAGFEWVTMDLMDDGEMKEVYELLNGHYVEDDEAMFRFNYDPQVLRWYVCISCFKFDSRHGVLLFFLFVIVCCCLTRFQGHDGTRLAAQIPHWCTSNSIAQARRLHLCHPRQHPRTQQDFCHLRSQFPLRT